MEFALLGSLIIGISLGLLGSGGSILTVPVLIFILQRPEKQAIAESLGIVGIIALMGAIPYILRTQVYWRYVVLFGLPGMLGAYIGGCCSYYLSGSLQLTLFACVMLLVAILMLFAPSLEQLIPSRQSIWLTSLQGLFVGTFTGIIGVGGGFLIVPTLVILGNLTMSLAIGTSLIIIALNSFTGFLEQLVILDALHLYVDWKVIAMSSSAGILGSVMGGFLSQKISQIHLRKIFGLSVLFLGLYILIKQIY